MFISTELQIFQKQYMRKSKSNRLKEGACNKRLLFSYGLGGPPAGIHAS